VDARPVGETERIRGEVLADEISPRHGGQSSQVRGCG
jgi:hypothetical protein